MTRSFNNNELATDSAGNVLAGRAFTVWTAETGGTQVTTVVDWTTGSSLAGGIVLSDSKGRVRFKETTDGWGVLWLEGPDGDRNPLISLETGGSAGGGGGNVSDNTTETITAAWTFSTNPVFNNGAIPQAKVVNLTTDLAAAANPVQRADTANQAAMLALTANKGDWTYRTDTATVWELMRGTDPTVLANWVNLGAGTVGSVGYDGLPAGVTLEIFVASTAARPTARTDIPVRWWTTDGVFPVNALSGVDSWVNALVVVPA